MKLWQLKNPQTNENIGPPQSLPENWGPIFGMEGVKDRLGDLSWLGITDRCWIEVEVENPSDPVKKDIDDRIDVFINESNQRLSDTSLTKGKWQELVEYQKQLQNIPLQPGYPNEVLWPTKPE